MQSFYAKMYRTRDNAMNETTMIKKMLKFQGKKWEKNGKNTKYKFYGNMKKEIIMICLWLQSEND